MEACKQKGKEERQVLIGELLVEEGYVSEKQLQDALASQMKQRTYVPLGEMCVRLRFISRAELKAILKKHKKRVFLGELLVNMGLLSQEEIEHALEIQRIEEKKLGKILIENGFITETNLINSLSTQLGIPKIIPTIGLIDPSVLKGISKAFLQKNECLPMYRDGDVVTVIMSDPLSEETITTMKNVFKCKIEPAIASADDINKALKLFYEDIRVTENTAWDKDARNPYKNLVIGDSVSFQRDEDNIIDVLNFIISNALRERASDIHIEPMENMLRVRYRIDGVLHHKTDLPMSLAPSLSSRIKALCGMDIADRRRHQDGRLGAKVMNRCFDLRVSTYASLGGESIAIRVLPNQSNVMDLDMLGFSPTNLYLFRQMLEIPAGIIMVTGPSNCGKTTTLYAALLHLGGMDKKIVTMEDPIEYTIQGVVQGQINERTDLTYANFVKSVLRQDPDVIMIGEIRDRDSAKAVIETALTGHKILTSFHTDDTSGALLRMFEIGIETFLISSTVMSVMAQRLVRVLCPSCRLSYTPSNEVLNSFRSIRPINLDTHTFYTANGCLECNNTGYKGRTAINEIMLINDEIRDALLKRVPSSKIRALARQTSGLISIQEDGFYKATKGITSLEEVLRLVNFHESDAMMPYSSEELVRLCEMGGAAA
jgi:type IV pilus assembly protein PilB